MSKYRLSEEQKDEIRRLTQLANRRIRTTAKAYENAGKTVLPRDVVGRSELQDRSSWHTKNTPLSRSVVFDSKADYEKQLRFLRSFDPKAPGHRLDKKPTMTQYTEIQRTKTAMAMTSSLGIDVPTNILERINQLTAPQLSEFWSLYSKKATKLGARYSSLQAMQETLNELFPEDVKQFEGMATVISTRFKAS